MNCGLLRYKSEEFQNEHYTYKTKECLELHDKLYHSQQEKRAQMLEDNEKIPV